MDALETSHPIEVEIHTARAVDETFVAISYKKRLLCHSYVRRLSWC